MDEVADAIADAWDRVKLRLANNPRELRKRLARTRQVTLAKTPRARCLALRANDLRLEDTDAAPTANRYVRHDLWLYADDVERLCAPIEIEPPGETVDAVAAKLGLTPMGLLNARL